MLKVVGTKAALDEEDGRSLLDEIAREGARRMLVVLTRTLGHQAPLETAI